MHVRTRTLITTVIAVLALVVFAANANANAPESNDGSKPAPTCEETSSCPSTTPPPVTTTTTTTTEPETEVPETEVPAEEVPDTPDVEVPDDPDVTPNVPSDPPVTGGGEELPFTGPGDVMLAIIIALLAGSGGMLLMLGAAPREALERLNRRTMSSPSAFRVAYREHLKREFEE